MHGSELCRIRARAYRLFARLLDYPYDNDVPMLSDLIRELKSLLEEMNRAISEHLDKAEKTLARELREMGRDEFQAAYVSTFELGMPTPPCPPYESAYVRPGEVIGETFIEAPGTRPTPSYLETKSMMDVLSALTILYEESGVKVRETSPDHLPVELEFASYLLDKQAEALEKGNEEEARHIAEKYRDLLDKHLTLWIPRLAGCLARRSKLRAYYYLTEALNTFIRIEAERTHRQSDSSHASA